MASTGFDAYRALVDGLTADGRTTLIAAPGHRKAVSEVLVRMGLDYSAYDSVEQLLSRSVDDRQALILLCVDDTGSRLLGCVEPLTRHFPDAPVVLICPTIERWGIRTALAAGIAGIVMSEDINHALAACVLAVHAGQTCVPRAHSRQIEPPALSTREKQSLGLVVMGYTNSQIAQQLFLAESTVKSHLSSAFGKLGVRSRNEAVSLILDPERGLGMGILALGGEPLESTPAAR